MSAMPSEVQDVVRSFVELSPGTAAREKNLEAMLALIRTTQATRRFSVSSATLTVARPMVGICLVGPKKKPERLVLEVYESALLLENGAHREQQPHPIFRSFQPWTPQGLGEGFREGNAALAALARGLCERCLAHEPPYKRLKTIGMSGCTECSIAAVFRF